MIQEVLEVIVGQSPDQSVLTVQRIIHDHPDNLWAWSLLCYVLFVLGRVGAAKSTLQIVTFKGMLHTCTYMNYTCDKYLYNYTCDKYYMQNTRGSKHKHHNY